MVSTAYHRQRQAVSFDQNSWLGPSNALNDQVTKRQIRRKLSPWISIFWTTNLNYGDFSNVFHFCSTLCQHAELLGNCWDQTRATYIKLAESLKSAADRMQPGSHGDKKKSWGFLQTYLLITKMVIKDCQGHLIQRPQQPCRKKVLLQRMAI